MASRKSEEWDRNGLAEPEEGESEKTHEKDETQRKGHFESNWGFSLEELFGLAIKFFKGRVSGVGDHVHAAAVCCPDSSRVVTDSCFRDSLQEMSGKAFNPTYEENLQFVALQKQALLGPYSPKACPEVGFFDVLGNDRRKEWARLGSMSKTDAMEDFVKLLNSCCNLFSPYVTSHKIKKEEHERRIREEECARAKKEEQERREKEQRCKEERRLEEERTRLLAEQQRQQLMATLHAQTVALQQFPDQPEQQQLLIQQLQEQQYQQYIQQAYCQNTAKDSSLQSTASNDVVPGRNHSSQSESTQSREEEANHDKSCHLFIEGKPGEVPIKAPSMWTRPQIQNFKDKMEQDADGVITVGRGEVLTVRVPTNKDGSYFFWEFATDYYDIAFGLYFEWPNRVNVTTAENLGESASDKQNNGQDEGSNGRSMNGTSTIVPVVSEVVPLYRRDSHEDVYAGSHQYPGQGVYLLRFDNSYSLWRSKIVYYRVYYTT